MAKFKGAAYLDGGPDLLRARAATAGRVVMHLLVSYTLGQNFAAVVGNSLGSVALSASDITTSGSSGSARVTTIASKSITLTGAASGAPDLHLAVVDTSTSEVLFVTDESSNPAEVEVGGIATVAAFTDTLSQPA